MNLNISQWKEFKVSSIFSIHNGKGITKEEIAEIVTHAAFYCGWPKAWAVFRMAKEVWNEGK